MVLGDRVRVVHKRFTPRDVKSATFGRAVVIESESVTSTQASGDMVVVVDRVDRKADRVTGRVYGAFDDRGRSFVVGRLEAAICHNWE